MQINNSLRIAPQEQIMYRNQTSCIISFIFYINLHVPLLKITPTVAWVRQARLQLLVWYNYLFADNVHFNQLWLLCYHYKYIENHYMYRPRAVQTKHGTAVRKRDRCKSRLCRNGANHRSMLLHDLQYSEMLPVLCS